MPKPRFSGGRVVITRPSNSTDPVSGDSSPATIRSVVVLPQPDGPSRPKNSPRSTAIETSATAGVAPKRLEILFRESSGMRCWALQVGSCSRKKAQLKLVLDTPVVQEQSRFVNGV